MVSSGLAALGYHYVNLGNIFSSALTSLSYIPFSVFLFFLFVILILINLSVSDDCWGEPNRDSEVIFLEYIYAFFGNNNKLMIFLNNLCNDDRYIG